MGRYRGRHAAARQTEFTAARLRRGVSSAAVAAAAMAALTASQAPGFETVRPSGEDDGPTESTPDLSPGDDAYHTELPPLRTPAPPEGEDPGPGSGDDSGIPATVLAAYKKAERSLSASDPGCNLSWELLAAIGKVESGQARGGAVDAAGTTLSPILGPQLNGVGFARIEDTDGGAYDGDDRFDRAVGPLQFIPSTWANWGADGNGDGKRDPNNVFDAALAAGAYLCHGERDLAVKADLDRAILSYNNSRAYLNTVLAWFEFYRDGVHKVPDGTGVLPTTPGGGSDDGTGDGGHPGGPPSSGGDEPAPDDSTDPTDPTEPPGEPTDPPTDPTDPPTEPADELPATLQPVEEAPVTVPVGGQTADGFPVRVLTEDAEPVADVTVRYTLTDPQGEVNARFADGRTQAEAVTDAEGVATAPALLAGEHTGSVTVRAAVVGHEAVTPAEFTVDVEAAELQRTGDEGPLTAEAGEACPSVRIRATYGGEAAAGVPVDATVLAADGATSLEDGTGPYFAADDEDGRTHTLEELPTNAEGELTLPELHAGSQPGTYTLKLTTADGGSLVLDIEITAASTTEPTPSASPSTTEPTPSASASTTEPTPSASASTTEPTPSPSPSTS